MRTIKLSLIAAAIFAAGTVEARAAWPVVTSGHQMNGFGFFNAFGVPSVQQFHNGNSFGQSIYSPGAYRTVFAPNAITRVWASQSMSAFSFNPQTGLSIRITSPSFVGFTFSQFGGMRTFAVPGTTISSGLDTSVTGGINGIGTGLMGNSFFGAGLSSNTIFNNNVASSLIMSALPGVNVFSTSTNTSLSTSLLTNANFQSMTTLNRAGAMNVPVGQPVTFGSVTGTSAGPGLWFFSGLNVPRPIGGKTAVAPTGYILP